jgi:hypothetical protein
MTRALDAGFAVLFCGMLAALIVLGIAAALIHLTLAPLVKFGGLAILRRGR